MKKALVYVHSSKGELDWIVPFIKYSAGDFEYDLFIEMVGNTTDEKKGIIKDYRLDGVVNLVESKDVFNEKQFLLFKVVNRLRDYSRK